MPDPAERETGPPPAASPAEVAKAVLWSLFGVRKRTHLEKDAVHIRPHQLVIVALVLVAVFVVLLITVVRLIVRAAG